MREQPESVITEHKTQKRGQVLHFALRNERYHIDVFGNAIGNRIVDEMREL